MEHGDSTLGPIHNEPEASVVSVAYLYVGSITDSGSFKSHTTNVIGNEHFIHGMTISCV